MVDIGIEPTPWSRNWDDADEENEFKDKVWEPPVFAASVDGVSLPLHVKVLFIGLRGGGSCFLHAYFRRANLRVVGSIHFPNSVLDSKTIPKPSDKCCTVATLGHSDSVAVVFLQYEVDPDRSYAWAHSLLDNVKADRVIVLDTLRESLYQSENPDSVRPPFLRALFTDAGESVCPPLEPPNLVDRVPAAILSYCQLRKIKATLFISIEDRVLLESNTLRAYEQVMASCSSELPLEITSRLPTEEEYRNVLAAYKPKSNPLFI
mmetsp:Transcript_23127/g.38051  ORF Transcript_23127/g.38051 Transcript_23127/m.38051 type:complete len:263 (+) Transcript_23127:58-846(+)